MAKNDKAREMAEQIQAWRGEGLTDAKIIAKHGSDDLSAGYRWLEENPSVAPAEATADAPRPARGTGTLPELVALSPR